MILRKDPQNKNEYIKVDSNTSIQLHRNGFIPKYISLDGRYIYYIKDNSIKKFMQDNNLTTVNE